MVHIKHLSEPDVTKDASIWLYLTLSEMLLFLEEARIPARRIQQYMQKTPKGLPPSSTIRGVKSGTLEKVASKSILAEFFVHDGESRSMWERKGADEVALRTSINKLKESLGEDRYIAAIVSVSNKEDADQISITSSTDTESPISLTDIWSYFGYKDNSYDSETPVRLCGVRSPIFDSGQMQPRKLSSTTIRKNVGFSVDRDSAFDEIVVGPKASSWIIGLLEDYASEAFSLDTPIRGSEFD